MTSWHEPFQGTRFLRLFVGLVFPLLIFTSTAAAVPTPALHLTRLAASDPTPSVPILDVVNAKIYPTTTNSAADSTSVTIYMADGQMKSWPVAIFVNYDIPNGVVPQLKLIQGHAVTTSLVGEDKPITASVVSSQQQWTGGAEEDGIDTQHHGTWLLFDLSRYPFAKWKAMTRVRPEVTWTENGSDAKTFTILGKRLVNVGNAPVAWCWTIALFLLLLGVILSLARTAEGWTPLALLCADDGHLSLSKCQMALWTVAIGIVVSFFAFVRLDVPNIPVSLVVLMGLSVVTTGISYYLDRQPNLPSPVPDPAPVDVPPVSPASPKFADLLVTRNETSALANLSLTRAQMLLWTLLLVVIFLAKSILSGVLWDIPWTLVALMGVSYTGYLAPKYQ